MKTKNKKSTEDYLRVAFHDLVNHITSISLQCTMLLEPEIKSIEAKKRIANLDESCRKARQYINDARRKGIL